MSYGGGYGGSRGGGYGGANGGYSNGYVTIKASTQLATWELETILQPIPMGMSILGLELKSMFARLLPIL